MYLAMMACATGALAQSAAFTSEPTLTYAWREQHCPEYPAMPIPSCVPDIREYCDPDVVDACPRLWANNVSSYTMLGSVDNFSRAQKGDSLDTLTHTCQSYANATYDTDLAHFRNHEWIEAPVAFPSNGTVYALTHVDSLNGTSQTSKPNNYLYTSITLFVSTDGGETFQPALPPPGHLIATSPLDNRNGTLGAGIGFGMPSSVLWVPSQGYYYVMLLANWGKDIGPQKGGLCLLRTADIMDPASWRAWTGPSTGFSATLNASPLLQPIPDPSAHTCEPLMDVNGQPVALRHTSLQWSSFYNQYMLFGEMGGGGALNGTGWAFCLSPDLLTWSAPYPVDTAGFINAQGNASISGPISPMPGQFIRADSTGTWWHSPDGTFKAPVESCAPCPGVDACSNVTVLPAPVFNAIPNATVPFTCTFVYNSTGYINYVYSVLADPSENNASGGQDPNFNTVGQNAHLFLVAKSCAGVSYTPETGIGCTPLDAFGRDQRDVVRATITFHLQ